MDRIKAYIVNGFLDAGKTSYIEECVFGGFFHKHGSTLVLAFEDGETAYDTEKLKQYRTEVVLYDGGGDVSSFCRAALERFRPDRVYVEMNAMREGLRESLPEELQAVFTVTLFDGTTLPLYYNNMRQLVQNMIAASDMAVFNRCPDKAALADYAVPFRLMNRRCDFLWQSELGYSEKAFGRLLPYDISAARLDIREEDYAVWHLDAHENPAAYEGKTVAFDAQVRNREDIPAGSVFLGRSVMTCCIRDIQFLGFVCETSEAEDLREGSWVRVTARAICREGRHGVRSLELKAMELRPAPVPEQLILGLSKEAFGMQGGAE